MAAITLQEMAAAIDDGQPYRIIALCEDLPEGVQGHILLAARAAKRAREGLADALLAACEGALDEGRDTAAAAIGEVTLVEQRLAKARLAQEGATA